MLVCFKKVFKHMFKNMFGAKGVLKYMFEMVRILLLNMWFENVCLKLLFEDVCLKCFKMFCLLFIFQFSIFHFRLGEGCAVLGSASGQTPCAVLGSASGQK